MIRIAATWKEAFKFLAEGQKLLENGACSEDAVEHVISRIEDDPEERTVGYNGYLTREGRSELDAAFMEGRARRIGAVAGLSGFRNPIRAARMVMEKTPHNLIVGDGACRFAEEMGLEKRDMITPESLRELADRKENGVKKPGHDTVGVIALRDGHFACGLSTCGFLYRMPGRVSDSAIPACGYFCDDSVGAAVCTGVGEDIMRGALASKAFFYMEAGEDAETAARRAVGDAHLRVKDLGRVAVLCIDKNGNIGGSANHNDFVISKIGPDGNAFVDPVAYCFKGQDVPVGEELYL